jgi:hypothetical protein
MTSPAFSSTPDPRRVFLLRYLKVQDAADDRLRAALEDALQDLDSKMQELEGKEGVSASVRRLQLVGSKGIITQVLTELFREVRQIISDSQKDAAKASVAADNRWARDILKAIEPKASKRKELEESLEETAARQVLAMMTRVLKTDMPLSSRVYRSQKIAEGQVKRLVNKGLASGASAKDIAYEVREFIRPSTPGGATYAAKRLARTEINNAFHAQAIANAQDRPWVIGMEWRLSGSHKPSGDLCEKYHQKQFEVDEVPKKPHPQCMCYVFPKTEDLNLVIAQAKAGAYNQWAEEHSK